MKQFLLVFIGGGFGSLLRYLISRFLNLTEHSIPYGTLAVNIIGSLLIGFIMGMALKGNTLQTHHTLFLTTGFCGGFTTFSTFAYENQNLLKSGDFLSFTLYTAASFILAISFVWLGLYAAKSI